MKLLKNDDEELIRLFNKDRDPDAFNELINRHKIMIRKIIYTVLCSSNHFLIDDIEQEILISIFKGLKKFRFRSSFTTWLYRICHNKAIDYLKKEYKEEIITGKLELEQTGSDPEELYLLIEKKEELFKAISTLNEKERMIILLKDIEQLPIIEVSKIMGLPVGTVKSRLHRSREKLSVLIRGKV